MQRYKKIKINGKSVSLHCYVVECHLGRSLGDDEVVHHINGDRFDNRIENLEVTSHKAHSVHHNQKHAVERACDVCGVVYAPHPTKRARSRTCSRMCFKALASRLAIERSANPGYRAKLCAAAQSNGSVERARTLVLHRWRKV